MRDQPPGTISRPGSALNLHSCNGMDAFGPGRARAPDPRPALVVCAGCCTQRKSSIRLIRITQAHFRLWPLHGQQLPQKASRSHALARPSFLGSIPSSCGWNRCGIPGLTRRWALYTRNSYPALLPPEPRFPCRGSLVCPRHCWLLHTERTRCHH
jgi:hypothetical protein